MPALAIVLGILVLLVIAMLAVAMYLGGGGAALRTQLPLLGGLGIGLLVAVAVVLLALTTEEVRWPATAFISLSSAAVAAWEARRARESTLIPAALRGVLWSSFAVLALVGLAALAATFGLF